MIDLNFQSIIWIFLYSLMTWVVIRTLNLIFKPLLYCIYYKLKYGSAAKICYFPIIGFVYQMIKSEEKYQNTWEFVRKQKEKNPNLKVLLSNLGGDFVYITFGQQTNKDILLSNSLILDKQKFIGYEFNERGIFNSYGKVWKQGRNVLSQAFNFDSLVNKVPLIRQVVKEAMEDLSKNQKINNKNINIINEMQNITGEVALRSFFGSSTKHITFGERTFNQEIAQLAGDMFQLNMSPYAFLKFTFLGQKIATYYYLAPIERKLIARYQNIKELGTDVINKRIQSYNAEKKKEDVLDYYVEALVQEKYEKGNEITKDEILQQFLAISFAATDTTGNWTSMALYCLAKYPEVYEKVTKEIDQYVKDYDSLDYDVLKNKLTYCWAFLQEVLRFFPPVPNLPSRLINQTFNSQGIEFAKGHMLTDIFFYDFMNPDYFEDPLEFRPDRWLKEQKHPSYAFTPFSAGPRNCLGQHLAILEAKIILIGFIKTYKPVLNEGVPFCMKSIITNAPKNQNILRLEKLQ